MTSFNSEHEPAIIRGATTSDLVQLVSYVVVKCLTRVAREVIASISFHSCVNDKMRQKLRRQFRLGMIKRVDEIIYVLILL